MRKTILAIILLFSSITAQQPDTTKQYPIDTNHSTVGFTVSIMGGLSKVNGKFTEFMVDIVNNEKEITRSSVSVVIKAASIDTGIAERDKHLRSADFFDVEKYPNITFQSERIEKKGERLFAVGTLTMRGVSKQIALPFSVTGIKSDPVTKKMSTGYSAHLTLNRRDFGIYWEQAVRHFVSDDVEIEINLISRALNLK